MPPLVEGQYAGGLVRDSVGDSIGTLQYSVMRSMAVVIFRL